MKRLDTTGRLYTPSTGMEPLRTIIYRARVVRESKKVVTRGGKCDRQ